MKKQLVFHFDDKQFTVAHLNLTDYSISSKSSLDVSEIDEKNLKSEVSSWIDSLNIDSSRFDEFSCSYSGFKQTFVPNELFNSSNAKELFEFNFGPSKIDIDFKRIPELGMVTIFEFPLWLKSLFVIKFPHINLFHKSIADTKGIFNYPSFKEKTYLFREQNALSIYHIAQGKITFFNRFKVVNWEDLTYYTLLVLNNEKVSKENEIVLCDFENNEEIEKLKSFIDASKGSFNLDLNEDFSLKNQRLCV